MPRRDRGSTSDFREIAALIDGVGRPVVCRLRGASMGKAIPDGSLIRIHPTSGENCDVGDVVVYIVNGALVAHRVVHVGIGARLGKFVLTQGDGWIACDPPIDKNAVLGVVTEFNSDGAWRTPSRVATRSPQARIRSRLNEKLIRSCMSIDVGMAQWIARTLLIFSSPGAILYSLRFRRKRGDLGDAAV